MNLPFSHWQILKTHQFCFEMEIHLLVWNYSKNVKYVVLLLYCCHWHHSSVISALLAHVRSSDLNSTKEPIRWWILHLVFWALEEEKYNNFELRKKKLRLRRWNDLQCVRVHSKTNRLLIVESHLQSFPLNHINIKYWTPLLFRCHL